MDDLTIDLDPLLEEQLRVRAASNGRSLGRKFDRS
jgi:plasmid stability protein